MTTAQQEAHAWTPDVLTRVRTNPFLRFDADPIRRRAHLRSESIQGTPLEHWLAAEAEETIVQANARLVSIDTGEGLGAEPFDKHYVLANSVSFPTFDPQEPKVIGTREPRRCTLCQRTAPTVRFRTAAHVLPEAVGSRWLTTYDECDECNGDLGRRLENELGAMLLPERVMARLPTKRSASAKLKIWDDASSIGGQGRDEALAIALRQGEESVRTTLLGDHEMAVEAKTVPFRPIPAIKSLARTAWHLLPPAERQRHDPMRRWIRGELSILPAAFWRFFLPGFGLRHTTFAVWTTIDPTTELPPLVFALAFGNAVVLWTAPDWSQGIHRPALLPLLPRPLCPTPAKIQGGKWRIERDEQVKPGTVKYDLGFVEHGLTWTGNALPVVMVAETPEGPVQLESLCSTPRPLADAGRLGILYEIRGGELVGEMHVERAPTPQPIALELRLGIRFRFRPTDAPPASVTKTQSFLAAFLGGAPVRITERDGGRLVARIPGGSSDGLDAEFFAQALQVCVAVGQINREFGTAIELPAEGDPESERNALLLAAAMKDGHAAEVAPGGTVTILVPIEAVSHVVTAVVTGPHVSLPRADVYPVYGTDITPGDEVLMLEDPQLVRSAEELQRDADAGMPGARIAIDIACRRVIHRFARWYEKPAGGAG